MHAGIWSEGRVRDWELSAVLEEAALRRGTRPLPTPRPVAQFGSLRSGCRNTPTAFPPAPCISGAPVGSSC